MLARSAASPLPATDASPWCAVVVLGAGRSGTSAVARGLGALGIELGDRLRRGGGKNPTGFFEDRDLIAITNRLKRHLGLWGGSVSLIEAAEWQAPAVQELREDAAATIRRRFGDRPLWAFKHGRTLRFLPFWEDVFRSLELDVRYVVATRNPLSIARSRGALDPRRGVQTRSDLEWLVNVVPYFRLVRDRRFVVLDYDDLIAEPRAALERIGSVLGLPVSPEIGRAMEDYARDFLQLDRRHSHFSERDLEQSGVHELVRSAYGWLRRLAADEAAVRSADLWREWQRIEDGVAALAPVLRHLDRVEGELWRAQWNPASPVAAAAGLWRKLRDRWP